MTTIDQRVYAVFCKSVSDAYDWETWQTMTSLSDCAAVDSMAILEFLAGLEKEFKVTFPSNDLELSLFTDRPRLTRYLVENLRVS